MKIILTNLSLLKGILSSQPTDHVVFIKHYLLGCKNHFSHKFFFLSLFFFPKDCKFLKVNAQLKNNNVWDLVFSGMR